MLMRTPTRWARPKLVRPPGFIVPCQPILATKVPAGDGWLHELKHDGFRILAYKDGERVRPVVSQRPRPVGRLRRDHRRRARPPLPASCSTAKRSRTASRACRDFHRLLSGDGQASACLYAFDLIWLEAQDLRGVELIGRRRMLQKALKKAGPALRFSEHMEGADGEAMFRHACAMGLEGIVSKRVASRYKSGSCLSWVKVKNPAYERR